jgi:hypothetical protein
MKTQIALALSGCSKRVSSTELLVQKLFRTITQLCREFVTALKS